MKPSLHLALLALEASIVAGNKFVSVPFERRKAEDGEGNLQRRAGPVQVSLINAQVLYVASVTVGTPAQKLQLQLDTGSSDVWMTDASAQYCSQGYQNCQGGTFKPGSSTTYKTIANSDFNITYVDGSGSTGNYFTDTFTVSGATLQNLQMGLATDTTIGTGIIGVCFEADESVCTGGGRCPTYPSIMSQMVSQGVINSQAYSLFLDDLDAKTGSIIFGGVDTAKYEGSLATIPIQVDSSSRAYTSFSVALTSVGVTTGSSTQTLTSSNFAVPAILDSGTSLMLLPDDLFNSLTSGFQLEYQQASGVYIAPCSAGSSTNTFNFQFGGANGPTIKVATDQFFEPIGSGYTVNGQTACEFGILPAGQDPILFGDTFLRSAYVVYDLDNKQISLAQANFDSTSSNVQAIAAGANGVPGVSSTVTGVTVDQTGTAVYSYGVVSATGSGAAQKTGTATALSVPGSSIGGLLTLGLASLAALLGSCMIFL